MEYLCVGVIFLLAVCFALMGIIFFAQRYNQSKADRSATVEVDTDREAR